MIAIFKKTLQLLSKEERRQLYLLFFAMAVMGLIEVAGIASIAPFLAVVSDPEVVQTNPYLNWAYTTFPFETENQFLFVTGLLVLFVLIFSNAFSAFTTWLSLRFSWMRNHTISKRLLERYLAQPYVFYLNRNSADLAKNLFSEVQQVVTGIMVSGANLVARLLVTLFIAIFLFIIDPVLAVVSGLVLGGAYAFIYVLVRKRLKLYGEARVTANTARYKVADEAFGGIKDVKVLGREQVFLNDYEEPSREFATYQAAQQVIAQLPRYLLEVIAFGGILMILLYLLATEGNLNQVIPLLGLYAFAGYRLMPAVRQIFQGVTSLRYNARALSDLHDDITELTAVEPDWEIDPGGNGAIKDVEPLAFKERISMEDVVFQYPGAAEATIRGMSLEINHKDSVAFVGPTGCGKTTTVDLILGLLGADDGEITVDGTRLDGDTVRAWQNNVGYVSQHIYLCDDTIAKNIAFGVPEEEIDMEAVKKAAEIASIHSFIDGELAKGYKTKVGERGVRLSGGQRQRIGIARALYDDPELLVFDEATSALDGATETAIMESIGALMGEKTIVMIAHRLSTVRDCDTIFVIDDGKVSDKGTYEDLLKSSLIFQKIAGDNGQS